MEEQEVGGDRLVEEEQEVGGILATLSKLSLVFFLGLQKVVLELVKTLWMLKMALGLQNMVVERVDTLWMLKVALRL